MDSLPRPLLTLQDFTVGERVYYFMKKSPKSGRFNDWYLPSTVVKISATRLILRVDRFPENVRATTPTQVRKFGDPQYEEPVEGL